MKIFLKDLNFFIARENKEKDIINNGFLLNITRNLDKLYLMTSDSKSLDLLNHLIENNMLNHIEFEHNYYEENYIQIYNPSIDINDEEAFYIKLKYPELFNGE